jgi:exosortase
MTSATTETLSGASPGTISRAGLVLVVATLLALWFVLCRHLSGEWSVNEQYSYGWFVPFFALFLFWLRWEDRPTAGRNPAQRPTSNVQPSTSNSRRFGLVFAILALVLLLPIRVFELANPDWRPLAWLHAAIVVALSLLVIWRAGGTPWLRHFAFPICFIFVAVPWISAIEQPIVHGLMRLAAMFATEAITLCGVPAQLEGSLIRVSTGLVGVNEACSGVRSLQTSLMIGLLFGELKRLSLAKRTALVLGALVIALVANFGRAFFLVWIATSRGVSAVSDWHDTAGYAIVALVFCGSLLLATILGRDNSGRGKAEGENAIDSAGHRPSISGHRFRLPTLSFALCFAWLVAVEAAAEGWYRAHESGLQVRAGWGVQPPENAPGFREIEIDENVRQILRFDEGREVMWKTSDPAVPGFSATNYLFFFRWNPGSASVLRARSHRPDICLPNVGWQQIADRGTKTYFTRDQIPIVARHITFRQGRGNAVAHTFFCLQEDKINPNEPRPDLQSTADGSTSWSTEARLRVVRSGIRNLGQQVLEVILLSSPPLDDQSAEDRFGQLVHEVVVPSP